MFDGRADPALATAGHAQAAAVAARLAAERPDRIFVSSLRRTRETAAPLAAACGLEPFVISDLREVGLGELEGGLPDRTGAGRRAGRPRDGRGTLGGDPGRRAAAGFRGPVRGAVTEVAAVAGAGARVVGVAHGAVIGELCRQATESRPFAFMHADNGSISRLVVHLEGRWLLRSFNDISHLQPGSRLDD